MALAILVGLVAGFAGSLALIFALRMSKRMFSTSMLHMAAYGLGGFFVSLLIVAIALFACSKLAHDMTLPFGLAEVFMLIVATSVYVVSKNGSKKKEPEERKVG